MEAVSVAVKYVRGDEGGPSRMAEEPMGPVRRLNRLEPKKRLLIIYLGLMGFAMLLVLTKIVSTPTQFAGRPMERGEGVILKKEVRGEAEPGYFFEIEVSLPDAGSVVAYGRTDAETFEGLEEGDRIGVLYQTNRRGTELRIRETGLVALPPPIR